MQVKIKSFDVVPEVKSKGIEFSVANSQDGAHVGDLYVTMTALIWCEGRTDKRNGVRLQWHEVQEFLSSVAAKKAGLAAAKELTKTKKAKKTKTS